MSKEKIIIPGVVVTPEALDEIRIISKKIEISREATDLVGKDPNFYAGIVNNLAELEIQKDKWMARQVALYDDKLPPDKEISIDLSTGQFVY